MNMRGPILMIFESVLMFFRDLSHYFFAVRSVTSNLLLVMQAAQARTCVRQHQKILTMLVMRPFWKAKTYRDRSRKIFIQFSY